MRILPFIPKAKGRWLLPALALVLAMFALVAMLLAHRWCVDAIRSETNAQTTLRMTLAQAVRANPPSCAPELAYAQSLPESVSLDKLVKSLQESAKAFGVTVLSVSGEPHPANDRSLASLVVGIALHGGYAGIKSTLAESLSRFPSAALQEMHLKRAGAAQLAMEDANVQIVFALRPTVSIPIDCRMRPIDGSTGSNR